ncbi:apoptosis-inducing factor 3-like [Oscarella lobularis]|uniref:apoptosis-inducing factor 3-like n=1 Tax=Oscarella lobularis TaxID=121494 RepID=UPI0033133E42
MSRDHPPSLPMGAAHSDEASASDRSTPQADIKSIRSVVAREGDLKDGEMRQVELSGGGKALLVYQNGVYSAIGHKCTHYGAPLVKGALGDGRVRCPWHGACFNVLTGDIEDFPGLDGLACYSVQLEDGDIVLKASPETLKSHKRTMTMSHMNTEEDSRLFLLIGGGGASAVCAETLRQKGFKGRIVLATREADCPYDRPKLTKAMTAKSESIQLRSSEFYKENGIEIQVSKEAVGLDLTSKSVSFSDGSTIKYDKLMIGTGGSPKKLDLPGEDLQNVFQLRTPENANQIISRIEGKNFVVIGSSFIGMEVAASTVGKAKSVTVIGRSEVPFARVLGPEIGKAILKMHIDKGVRFIPNAKVEGFSGNDGNLTGVIVNGETLPAEVCLVGAGVVPSTGFLKETGIPLSDVGNIIVDRGMKALDDVYAGGDIVEFPLPLIDESVNIGHWQIACAHGRIAAQSMLGQRAEFNSVPFFWTQMFGKSLRYCGYAKSFDTLLTHGDVEELKFAAFYARDGKVTAVASMNMDPVASRAAEILSQGRALTPEEMRQKILS